MHKMSLAGTPLEHFHVCAFFNSKEEEFDVLGPFYREAAAQGEKNLHIVDPGFVEEHKARLSGSGVDVCACEACGQLEVITWREAYLSQRGVFDKDFMLATVDALTGEGRDANFARTRIMGNMGWVFEAGQPVDKLMEYEAEVNEVLARNRQPAICVYDVSKLTGSMMMDLLRTHPLTLVGGVVQENPFYTPPSQMIEQVRARESDAVSASE